MMDELESGGYSKQDAIDNFIEKINIIPNVTIERYGPIIELNQQDYKGKSVRIKITDEEGTIIESKMDLGVKKHFDIDQEEYCFDISCEEKGVSLFANSIEQIFTEKLCSLLKFGSFNTRYKDIYDMFYCCDKMDREKLKECFDIYIFSNKNMKENNSVQIVKRVDSIFKNEKYREIVDKSDKRWLDIKIDAVLDTIVSCLRSLT